MLIGDQNMTPEGHILHREQMGIPPIPPHCRAAAEQVPYKLAFNERGIEMPYVPNPPQPQEELSGSQPRCSGLERRPVVCSDNVYGSRNPTQSEQMSNREFREIIDDVPAPSGSSNRPNSPPHEGKGKKCADYLVKMVQEGSAGLTNFLLSAAVSSAPAKEKIPDVTKVHEWHFRDLMHLPKAAQEE
jgi:Reverse transcriptase (RNA-dependent DNA polymerase)